MELLRDVWGGCVECCQVALLISQEDLPVIQTQQTGVLGQGSTRLGAGLGAMILLVVARPFGAFL